MADNKKKKPVQEVTKPYLTGSVVDEHTKTGALGIFGVMIMVVVITFLVSGVLNFDNDGIRIILNMLVEVLVLAIFYNSALGKGTEAVARGEILYMRQEKGKPYSDSELAVCFHPLKGFVTALLGLSPFILCGIILAVTANRQTTGVGTLPTWLNSYLPRSDIGDALVAYTQPVSMGLEDVMRLIVRVSMMPVVSMIGGENRDALLMAERLSPLILMLPAFAYGAGYNAGRQERTKIHTGIEESNKKRAKKEKKAQKARAARPKGPEQLN